VTGAAAAARAPVQPLKPALEEYQRGLILGALRRHGNNWSAAARELGVDRANLTRLAGRLGLKRADPTPRRVNPSDTGR